MEAAVQAVARESMTLLYTTRLPLALPTLERRLRKTGTDVRPAVEQLAADGHLVWGDDGLITGVSGLSVVPTRHELRTGGVTRWTWCAWDALALAVLIGGTSEVSTTSPATGAPIAVRFSDGDADTRPPDAVLLFAERPQDCVTVRDWCPLVNMFESPQVAQEWMDRNEVGGEIQDVGPAARAGAESFRPFLDLAPERPPWWRRLMPGLSRPR